MFLPLSTHFTATLGIPLTSLPLQSDSFKAVPELSPGFSLRLAIPLHALLVLHPVIPITLALRITAAAGIAVSRGFLVRYRHFLSSLIELYIPRYFFTTRRRCIRFPHCAIFPLLPLVGVWAVSQSQCGCSLSAGLLIVALVSRYSPTS